MKLTFIGAAHEGTGSCHYIEACGKHILIDCGMEQGKDVFENIPIPVEEENTAISELGTEREEEAKKLLIEHYLRLVVYNAKKFDNTGIVVED